MFHYQLLHCQENFNVYGDCRELYDTVCICSCEALSPLLQSFDYSLNISVSYKTRRHFRYKLFCCKQV